jgi:cation transport ATPase
VYAGIGLSGIGMIVAAFGYLTPVEGAVLQEVIEVAVILNAQRALRGDPGAVATPYFKAASPTIASPRERR